MLAKKCLPLFSINYTTIMHSIPYTLKKAHIVSLTGDTELTNFWRWSMSTMFTNSSTFNTNETFVQFSFTQFNEETALMARKCWPLVAGCHTFDSTTSLNWNCSFSKCFCCTGFSDRPTKNTMRTSPDLTALLFLNVFLNSCLRCVFFATESTTISSTGWSNSCLDLHTSGPSAWKRLASNVLRSLTNSAKQKHSFTTVKLLVVSGDDSIYS